MSPKKKGIQPTEVGNPTEEEDLQYLRGTTYTKSVSEEEIMELTK